VDVKPSFELLRGYEFALERLEFVRSGSEYENRAVVVRSLEAWATARKPGEKAERRAAEEIPVTAPELRAEAYAAVIAHTRMGGQA
jgi:hypothetical protein